MKQLKNLIIDLLIYGWLLWLAGIVYIINLLTYVL
jgi:hypothetical protein